MWYWLMQVTSNFSLYFNRELSLKIFILYIAYSYMYRHFLHIKKIEKESNENELFAPATEEAW